MSFVTKEAVSTYAKITADKPKKAWTAQSKIVRKGKELWRTTHSITMQGVVHFCVSGVVHFYLTANSGIFFPEKKIVYLRIHESLDWLKQTKKMLREKGLSKRIRVEWGEKIHKELAEELRGL